MTAISGPVKGQVVYNTTNETLYRYNGTSWGKESTFSSGSFLHTQDTAASKWEVTHSLGVRYLNVEVIDSDSKLLIVEDISFNDSSSLEINFQTPRTGYVSVTSGGGQRGADGVSVIKGAVSHSQASASDAWVIDHNLNWQYPNITVYDNNNQVLIPQTITSADANRLTIDFDSPVQGYAGISSGGGTQGPSGSAVLQGAFTHSQATAATHWPVTHSLGAQWVNVEIIDGNNRSTIPQTITFDTPNKLSVDFSSPLSGYAAVTSGGGQTGPTGSRGAAGLGWFDGTTYISSSINTEVNVSGTLNVTASDSTIAATFDGNVSGSSSSTGSFGSIYTDKNVNATAFFGTVGAGATLGGVTMDVGGTDADGDIYYRSSNVLTRLAKGNDNDTLMMNGSVPNWEAVTAAAISAVASDAADKVLTMDGDGTATAEANLDFDGSTLTVTGDISNTGDLTVAGTIYETSAERFKTNIQPAGNQLEKVLKLNGVTFEKLNNYNRKEIGLIAEDVGEVYPEFVSSNSEAVNYGKMVAVLVEAIKELNEKIEKLEKGN
jgi:hypothetical protein